MKKVIQEGTEVLIFKYIRELGPNQDDENYIGGVVLSSKVSDDLSIHGSSYCVQIYEVLGEDGKKYIGTYGDGVIGNSFFRTKEDHIEALKRKISYNEEDILKLQEKNDEYSKQISLLENEIKEYYDGLAISCDRAFIVRTEKVEEFKKLRPNSEVRQQIEENAERLRVNNLTSEGPVFKKLIKKKDK